MAEATLVAFGCGGQVGQSLVEAVMPPGWRLLPVDRALADITNAAQVAAVLDGIPRGAVVNLAAYTQVDKAEAEPDAAFAINAHGAEIIAKAAHARDLPLIHLSTDYVFDGTKTTPWVEDDATGPQGVYGASKLAGEQLVLAAHARALVLRTAWVFGPHGNNFVRAILKRALTPADLGVVADQIGCPTPAPDIAAAVWVLATRLVDSHAPEDFGLFHYCGDEITTWFGFAQAILTEATARGRTVGQVRAITTADYPTAAKRPAYSALDCRRLAHQHGITPPPWRESLRICLPRLLEVL